MATVIGGYSSGNAMRSPSLAPMRKAPAGTQTMVRPSFAVIRVWPGAGSIDARRRRHSSSDDDSARPVSRHAAATERSPERAARSPQARSASTSRGRTARCRRAYCGSTDAARSKLIRRDWKCSMSPSLAAATISSSTRSKSSATTGSRASRASSETA